MLAHTRHLTRLLHPQPTAPLTRALAPRSPHTMHRVAFASAAAQGVPHLRVRAAVTPFSARASSSFSRSAFHGARAVAPSAPPVALSAAPAPARAAPAMVAAAPRVDGRKVGDVVDGFRLVRAEWIAEVSSVARIWEHEKTGAELISMINDDDNKSAAIVFRTPPNDSTGVPHVLEHSVLCGSRKYPVKEPFLELIKCSLNTFLNAMTSSVWTAYPVASCNEQDFYNLVDVYLDAVFHPNLTPDTLAQEGHHLELDKVGDPVTIKGVVFNEMRGAYNSPDRVLGMASQRVLYPDTTFGVESGGHPRDIPDLTWEQFKGFHEKFYHPSNSRIFFSGNDPEEKRLAKVNEFLSEFERREVDSTIGLQKKWTAPKEFQFNYDAGAGDIAKKYMATINWAIIDPPVDQFNDEELMALSIANHVLLAMSSSPLRKALTDSNLGEDVVGGGLDTDTRQMNFSVGLKGMAKESVPKMQAIVLSVLEDAAKNGFSKEMVDASLNSIEFRLRENNTGSFPKGLSILFRTITNWILEADPFESLKFEEAISKLRARLDANEPVFQEVISKYILKNPHRALVTLKPDVNFSKEENEVLQKRIDEATKNMSDADYEKIVENTNRLKAKQAAPDDPAELAKIPRLGRKDLDKKIKSVSYDRYDDKGVMILHHPLATNGVVYVDLCFDMSHVPVELLPLMSILVSALTELGTAKRDFVSLQQDIASSTGGIRSSTYVSQIFKADGNGPVLSKLTMRGKGMVNQVPKLLSLIREVIMDVDVNNKDRIVQLLLEERAGIESGIAGSGHSVAMGRLSAMFRKSCANDEYMGGLEFLGAVRSLIARAESDWDSVAKDMRTILDSCISRENMMVNVTTGAEDFSSVKPSLMAFLDELPAEPKVPGVGWLDSIQLVNRANEGLIVPSEVNYVAKAANLGDLGFETKGGHSLAAKHLGTSYLWDTVRVQGGAYGGFCRLDPRTGMMSFASYRDPNVKKTVDAYDGAAAYLSKLTLTEEELTKDTVGMIGQLDSYQLPDAKGFASALRVISGDTDEIRQHRRDQVMSASVKDYRELGDMLMAVNESGNVVVVGGEEALKKANDEGLNLECKNVL